MKIQTATIAIILSASILTALLYREMKSSTKALQEQIQNLEKRLPEIQTAN